MGWMWEQGRRVWRQIDELGGSREWKQGLLSRLRQNIEDRPKVALKERALQWVMNQLRSVLADEFIQQSITSGKRFVLQQEFRMITEWRIEHVRSHPMSFPVPVLMPCDHISVTTVA